MTSFASFFVLVFFSFTLNQVSPGWRTSRSSVICSIWSSLMAIIRVIISFPKSLILEFKACFTRDHKHKHKHKDKTKRKTKEWSQACNIRIVDLQAQYSENDFWAPDGDRTRNLMMTGETLWPLSYRDSDGELRCKSGTQKSFSEYRAWRSFIYLNISKLSRFLKH